MRRLWKLAFPADPPKGESAWERSKKCTATLQTPRCEHVCGKRGEHYDHVCEGEGCKFRWASTESFKKVRS